MFGLLTRRLRRLTGDVRKFTESDFDPAAAVYRSPADGDEIDQLGAAFAAMAARIREQFETLKETDRLRRELISNVSHDLRTPLASMQGYVETLLIKGDSLAEEERKRYLHITRKHAQRLARLVGDLFELSKLDASVRPSFETFSLAELLQDITQEFELEATRKDIDIDIEAPTEGTAVFADIGLIQRVLENLLRNALRFTPTGGRVTISVTSKPDGVAVAVADTGCGISEDDLPRIFDRFYRTEQGEEARSSSAGLGLAIVKRILDLHGSRITVASEINQGTRFEFDLRTDRAA